MLTRFNVILDELIKEYEGMKEEDRIAKYKEEYCNICRYRDCCSIYFENSYSHDILKPITSKEAWIPTRVICGKFEWQ